MFIFWPTLDLSKNFHFLAHPGPIKNFHFLAHIGPIKNFHFLAHPGPFSVLERVLEGVPNAFAVLGYF
jgi:hypothetical protein